MQQDKAVETLGKALQIIRDARMTVTGATLGPVADAVADLQLLERELAFGELELVDRSEQAGPPPEGGPDDPPF